MMGNANALAAAEHTADLRRAADRWRRASSSGEQRAGELAPAVELRLAGAGDAAGVRRLVELDEASPLDGPLLLALVAGERVAALALDDGRVAANPFVPTAAAVALLRLRAQQLTRSNARRHRLPRLLRPRAAT